MSKVNDNHEKDLYEDMSNCLKLFKANLKIIKKQFTTFTHLPALIAQINNNAQFYLTKYSNTENQTKQQLLLSQRFLARIKQHLEIQMKNSTSQQYIKYLKRIQYLLLKDDKKTISNILECIFLKTLNGQLKNTRPNSALLKLNEKNAQNQQGKLKTQISNNIDKQKKNYDRIFNSIKVNYDMLKCLGIQQSEHKRIFLQSRDSFMKNNEEMYQYMLNKNKNISEQINYYFKSFQRYQSKINKRALSTTSMQFRDKKKDRSIKYRLNESDDNIIKESNQNIEKRRNNSCSQSSTQEKTSYIISKIKKVALTQQPFLQNPQQMTYYINLKNNNPLHINKVLFSGQKIQLCPMSKQERCKKRAFYLRTRQYYKKKYSILEKKPQRYEKPKQLNKTTLQITNFKH